VNEELDSPETVEEARRIQGILAAKVEIIPFRSEVGYIAGVDAAFSSTRVFAAACLFSYPGLEPVEDALAQTAMRFPYISGYLSFREGPAIMLAVRRLSTKPDLILVDGQGIAHPRGIGIASHIGVLLDMPTIGCAKSRLCGEFVEPDGGKGERSLLRYRDKVVGAVLRTRAGVRPLFISPGHRVDLETSVEIALAATRRFRIPEPLRRADILSKRARAGPNYRL
jgi:deoxyribonuclease V